jgi:hypothetical protein
MVADGVRGGVTFKPSDRYCLDGQRLEIEPATANTDAVYGTQGTTYRTERDSFSRITATGGAYVGSSGTQATVPNSFRVETKAGLVLEFGLSAHSRVPTNFVPAAGANTVSRWLLQRISDRTPMGNFVEFVYCNGEVSADGTACNTAAWTGSTVLHYIRYTNRGGVLNGEQAVVFGYEARPDRVQTFHAGSAAQQTQRLSRITTYRDFGGVNASVLLQPGRQVMSYELAYQWASSDAFPMRATNTSRLQSITQRDAVGNALPPLQFVMSTDTVFGLSGRRTTHSGTPPPPSNEVCGGVMGNRLSLQCP